MWYQQLLGTLALLLVFVSGNGSTDRRPTNFEVLNHQLDSLSTAITSILKTEHDTSVSLETGSRSVDGLVRQKLLEKLLNDKFTVLEDSAAATRVRVVVPLMVVTYSAPVKSRIFGSPDVIRRVNSQYDVEISDSGRVSFAKSLTLSFEDTVSESEIPGLEAGSFGFLHGRIESTAFLDTVLQPVLFVASAAVIVYLFFTLRGT